MEMRKVIIAAMLSVAIAPAMHSMDFYDAGQTEPLFRLGVRIGANSSNLTNDYASSIPDMAFSDTKWKVGFNVGAVMDINIRNSFALQPGFFFQTRSNEYHYVKMDSEGDELSYYYGRRHSNYFQIPVLLSFRMGVSSILQLQVDFGPYFAFGLGDGTDKYSVYSTETETEEVNVGQYQYKKNYFGDEGSVNSYDWGLKMGLGLVMMGHYYVGVHYELGCRNVLKPIDGISGVSGHNRAWDFCLGYNF